MTKILVISDSHGNRKKLESLVNETAFDILFFLGDGLSDLDKIKDKNIKKVAGNCDFFSSEASTVFINVEDLKIMITHGHEYKSKLTKALMLEYAKQNNCDVVCSGHTHKQGQEYLDGILFLNPGAYKNEQYAILTIEKNKKPEVKFFS